MFLAGVIASGTVATLKFLRRLWHWFSFGFKGMRRYRGNRILGNYCHRNCGQHRTDRREKSLGSSVWRRWSKIQTFDKTRHVDRFENVAILNRAIDDHGFSVRFDCAYESSVDRNKHLSVFFGRYEIEKGLRYFLEVEVCRWFPFGRWESLHRTESVSRDHFSRLGLSAVGNIYLDNILPFSIRTFSHDMHSLYIQKRTETIDKCLTGDVTLIPSRAQEKYRDDDAESRFNSFLPSSLFLYDPNPSYRAVDITNRTISR